MHLVLEDHQSNFEFESATINLHQHQPRDRVQRLGLTTLENRASGTVTNAEKEARGRNVARVDATLALVLLVALDLPFVKNPLVTDQDRGRVLGGRGSRLEHKELRGRGAIKEIRGGGAITEIRGERAVIREMK